MTRIAGESAFLLHQRNYSESSLTLEVFTLHHGRLGLLAKGARRPRSPVRGVLALYQPLLIGWSGRGDLPILTGAEPDGLGYEILGSALYCGFYMNELLVRLLHRHDPHPALYTAYRETLAGLRADRSNEAVLRVFEKRLLQEIGYGLVLEHEAGDRTPIEPECYYDYILDRGPVRLNPELPNHVQGVRVRGRTLLALATETLTDSDVLRDAKQLTRAALAPYLGDRPLHSRRLFRTAAPVNVIGERSA